mmetsp:Transcript_2538/g.9024  ORF Transcript_2538/g.9024 Transcript_2538/m.9024 type:complete len:207 (+) Transcript_2538:258-878(+)
MSRLSSRASTVTATPELPCSSSGSARFQSCWPSRARHARRESTTGPQSTPTPYRRSRRTSGRRCAPRWRPVRCPPAALGPPAPPPCPRPQSPRPLRRRRSAGATLGCAWAPWHSTAGCWRTGCAGARLRVGPRSSTALWRRSHADASSRHWRPSCASSASCWGRLASAAGSPSSTQGWRAQTMPFLPALAAASPWSHHEEVWAFCR